MTQRLLLTSLAAGALALPLLVQATPAAAEELEIGSITVRPANPVVGATGSVRMVIDVVARGATGRDGVTITVEPGRRAAADPAPRPDPRPLPPDQQTPPQPGPPAVPAPPGQDGSTESAPQVDPSRPDRPVMPGRPGPPPRPAGPWAPGQAAASAPMAGQPGNPAVPAPPGTEAGSDRDNPTGKAGRPGKPRKPGKTRRQPRGDRAMAPPAEQGTPVRPAVPPADQALPVRPAVPPADQAHPVHPAVPPADWSIPVRPPVDRAAPVRPAVPPEPGTPAEQGVTVRPALPPAQGGTLAPVAPGREHGRATHTAAARLDSDWQTWRFLPSKDLDRRYPAGYWTVTATAHGAGGETVSERASFVLRRETRLTSAEVILAGGRRTEGVRVRGVLTRVDPKGMVDYAPFPGQEVLIERRRPDGVQWTRLATATTDRRGRFARMVTASPSGQWRIRFDGTTRYAAKTSAAMEVSGGL
ncbi:hypothetical protein [Spongiactinospora sp. TRM90649]|uniref:hypothetical protein n=1 Tax=Spongiactinospora sp. TRM90649 TaxID=3031114 RepID=UPI0023F9ADB0|nr:hypothetical protein [Spongiactinospora sp. TRM90649]MDF5753760.1 hypothetical protein [Spongiactinospora sp. TRM90649]